MTTPQRCISWPVSPSFVLRPVLGVVGQTKPFPLAGLSDPVVRHSTIARYVGLLDQAADLEPLVRIMATVAKVRYSVCLGVGLEGSGLTLSQRPAPHNGLPFAVPIYAHAIWITARWKPIERDLAS